MHCPACGHDNIEGADQCERCGQTLTDVGDKGASLEIERRILKDTIQALQPREPLCVELTTTVAEVLRTLTEHGVGCAMVMDDGKLAGVFSERDAINRLNADAGSVADEPIQKFMTPDPTTLKGDDKIAFALHQMDVGGYRHIPIVDRDGKLQGVISIRDILKYVSANLFEAEEV